MHTVTAKELKVISTVARSGIWAGNHHKNIILYRNFDRDSKFISITRRNNIFHTLGTRMVGEPGVSTNSDHFGVAEWRLMFNMIAAPIRPHVPRIALSYDEVHTTHSKPKDFRNLEAANSIIALAVGPSLNTFRRQNACI